MRKGDEGGVGPRDGCRGAVGGTFQHHPLSFRHSHCSLGEGNEAGTEGGEGGWGGERREEEENNIDEMCSYIICIFCVSRALFHYAEHHYSDFLLSQYSRSDAHTQHGAFTHQQMKNGGER